MRNNKWIKRIYETPYRIKMYFFCILSYYSAKKKLNKDNIDQIKKLNNLHKGERCFVVGTGPSLNKEDLKRIQNEICFTVNSGYRVMRKMGVIPNYYVVSDDSPLVQVEMEEVLADDVKTVVFSDIGKHDFSSRFIGLPINATPISRMNSWLNLLSKDAFPIGKFSDDISRVVYAGKTVVCIAIQIAAYMGFEKIYLLGIDMDYTGTNPYSDLVDDRKSGIEYEMAQMVSNNQRIQMEAFAKEARKRGIQIYNVTRGGKMECYERKNFDDIVKIRG